MRLTRTILVAGWIGLLIASPAMAQSGSQPTTAPSGPGDPPPGQPASRPTDEQRTARF